MIRVYILNISCRGLYLLCPCGKPFDNINILWLYAKAQYALSWTHIMTCYCNLSSVDDLSVRERSCYLLSLSSENPYSTFGDRGNEEVYQFFNGNFIHQPGEVWDWWYCLLATSIWMLRHRQFMERREKAASLTSVSPRTSCHILLCLIRWGERHLRPSQSQSSKSFVPRGRPREILRRIWTSSFATWRRSCFISMEFTRVAH